LYEIEIANPHASPEIILPGKEKSCGTRYALYLDGKHGKKLTVTHRHPFSERRLPLRQPPAEHPFSKLSFM
jgi:hypothetical protein